MIEEKVVIITGATGSLGTVVAGKLAEQGARLALIGTNAERLDRLAGDLRLAGDRVLTVVANLGEQGAAQESVSRVLEKFGRVDVLLHLVGGWTGGKGIAEGAVDELENMLDQHVWTTFHLAQALVPRLVENKWGRILVVSSAYAANPPAKMGPYVSAKAAQEALVLTIAREAVGTGVTANILQVRTIDAKHERDREPSPRNANWTTPEEIAAAIEYLCSDEARMVNGARIPLYGG